MAQWRIEARGGLARCLATANGLTGDRTRVTQPRSISVTQIHEGPVKPALVSRLLYFTLEHLERRDVCSLQALRAALRLVAHLLIFRERLEALAAHFGKVSEKIVAACIGSNEAKALAIVEPLNSTGIHANS